MLRHLLTLAALPLLACASVTPPGEVEQLLDQAVVSAKASVDLERPVEAFQFVSAADRIDPDHPGLSQLRSTLRNNPQVRDFVTPTLLGSNRARRYEIAREPAMRALLFLPDRMADLLDCVTFDLNFGPGVFLKYHITRAVQVGLGSRAVVGLGTYANRSLLGTSVWTGAEVSFLPWTAAAEFGGIAGAAGVSSGARSTVGLQRPTDEYFQEFDDYWSVGYTVTLGYFGANWWIHPVQFADFLAGWVGLDFLGDDYAHTRGVALSGADRALLRSLGRVVRSGESMTAYRASRAQKRGAQP